MRNTKKREKKLRFPRGPTWMTCLFVSPLDLLFISWPATHARLRELRAAGPGGIKSWEIHTYVRCLQRKSKANWHDHQTRGGEENVGDVQMGRVESTQNFFLHGSQAYDCCMEYHQDELTTNDPGAPAVSYRWTGWIWEITGCSSRMQENCPSF